jgi:hypothetical protein
MIGSMPGRHTALAPERSRGSGASPDGQADQEDPFILILLAQALERLDRPEEASAR